MGKQCSNEAAFRFTWPGRDESFICADHVPKLKAIAGAMGLPLSIVELDPAVERDHQMCRQQVRD